MSGPVLQKVPRRGIVNANCHQTIAPQETDNILSGTNETFRPTYEGCRGIMDDGRVQLV